ncbi:conserved hypothetical protein [Marinobacter salarius]|uniref:DUF6678 family protein n=2 Tax=Marinobacter salarius TaxID=1420917 RepID=UPI001254415E|nr:DUF6678 family protein [Marinobacter salarius]VVS96526.1 conserved hypothetical protein [Marinobacter salarius]VXC49980.1 conserved hypothetical protein [Marinobacter salarius]
MLRAYGPPPDGFQPPLMASVIQIMETDEQAKDRQRLERYIDREALTSVMSNTKWEKLRALMIEESARRPAWRVRCLRDTREVEPQWDGDWHYHLPEFKHIEWLEIFPIQKERKGYLLPDKVTDYFVGLLKSNSIPFSIEGESLRIWGYLRPCQAVEFV